MKSPNTQNGAAKAPNRKFKTMLIAASLMCGVFAPPAFAGDDHDDRGNQHGHYGHYYHNDRGHRDRRDDRGYYVRERHDYDHSYFYSQPVYLPPPVYVEPQQSPGISLFLPLNFRR